jgi:predicted glycosyltransferase involved in capsule biosynthesis
MTVIIDNEINKKEFEKILTSIQNKRKSKTVDTSKYCGVIKLNKDALIIQKEMRDEWK